MEVEEDLMGTCRRVALETEIGHDRLNVCVHADLNEMISLEINPVVLKSHN